VRNSLPQFWKDRPAGYEQGRLVAVFEFVEDLHGCGRGGVEAGPALVDVPMLADCRG